MGSDTKVTTVAITQDTKQILEELKEKVDDKVAPLTATRKVIMAMALKHALNDPSFLDNF